MLGKKDKLVKDMKELDDIIKMYQQAFPDNPAFQASGKKKDKQKKQQEEVQKAEITAPKEPQVDIDKVVEDAISLVADSVILASLNTHFGEDLPGANQNILDALSFLYKSFNNL